MLSRAADSFGLQWKPPLFPERLRLNDWYLGVPHADRQHPSSVPFFPEVHEEVTRAWRASYSTPKRVLLPSSLPSTAEQPTGSWRSPSCTRHCDAAVSTEHYYPGGVIYVSHPRPASSRLHFRARLIELLDKSFLPPAGQLQLYEGSSGVMQLLRLFVTEGAFLQPLPQLQHGFSSSHHLDHSVIYH